VPLASIAVPLSGVVAIAGGLSIFAGLSRKTWRLAHRAVPDSGHADVAQVLDGNRSHDGANSNDFVHEKCLHARRGPADFSLRSRTVQPGRTTLTLNAPNKRENQMHSQSETRALAVVKARSHRRLSTKLFHEARTHSTWLPEPVPVELLRKAYELARLGPTSANASPARFAFLTTPGAKALLKPVLSQECRQNHAAPVTVIIAWDTEFMSISRLFPHADLRSLRRK